VLCKLNALTPDLLAQTRHIEIGHLAEVPGTAVAGYLAEFRPHHSAATYSNHVRVYRQAFLELSKKAAGAHDPWEDTCLRADEIPCAVGGSHSTK